MIKLELSVDEINIILNSLSVQPYREVYELIEKLKQEATEQLKSKPISDNHEVM